MKKRLLVLPAVLAALTLSACYSGESGDSIDTPSNQVSADFPDSSKGDGSKDESGDIESNDSSSSSESVNITYIQITCAEKQVYVGETVQFNVRVGGDREGEVAWESLTPEIASIDENGVVTGLAEGEATIQATSVKDPTKSATYKIPVEIRKYIPEKMNVSIAGEGVTYDEATGIYTVPAYTDFTVSYSLDVDNPVEADGEITYGSDFKYIQQVEDDTWVGRLPSGEQVGTLEVTYPLKGVDDLVGEVKIKVGEYDTDDGVFDSKDLMKQFYAMQDYVSDGRTLSQYMEEVGFNGRKYTAEDWGLSFLGDLYETLDGKAINIMISDVSDDIGDGSLNLSVNTPEGFQAIQDGGTGVEHDLDYDTAAFGFEDEPYVMRIQFMAMKRQFSVYTDARGAGIFVQNILNSVGQDIFGNFSAMQGCWAKIEPIYNQEIGDTGHTVFDFLNIDKDDVPEWASTMAPILEEDWVSAFTDQILDVVPDLLSAYLADATVFKGLTDVIQTTNANYNDPSQGYQGIFATLTNTFKFSRVAEYLSGPLQDCFKYALTEKIEEAQAKLNSYLASLGLTQE